MDIRSKKVIREYTVEHFLRRLKLVCPRCGKKVTVQFSLEKGPTAEYEEEEKIASVQTGGAPKEFSEEFIDRIVAAIESKEKRQTS